MKILEHVHKLGELPSTGCKDGFTTYETQYIALTEGYELPFPNIVSIWSCEMSKTQIVSELPLGNHFGGVALRSLNSNHLDRPTTANMVVKREAPLDEYFHTSGQSVEWTACSFTEAI